MKARYNKYFETDPGKATEYMLSEPEDTSRYVSVQYYTDNVMNVALPSTYRFMEKVIQELNAMYQEPVFHCTQCIWVVTKCLAACGWALRNARN